MKAYVITSGVIFGLVAVAHVLRMIAEGAHVTGNPWFLLITAVATGLAVWALSLLRGQARS